MYNFSMRAQRCLIDHLCLITQISCLICYFLFKSSEQLHNLYFSVILQCCCLIRIILLGPSEAVVQCIIFFF